MPSMVKSTISMVIFNSYFDITRGYLFLREELDNETVTKLNHELGYMIHIIVTYDGWITMDVFTNHLYNLYVDAMGMV